MKHLLILSCFLISFFSFSQKVEVTIQFTNPNPGNPKEIIHLNAAQKSVPGMLKGKRDSIYFKVDITLGIETYLIYVWSDTLNTYMSGDTFTALADTMIRIPLISPPISGSSQNRRRD